MCSRLQPSPFTILISSVGRRSQLVECFREAFHDLDVQARILGIDSAPERAPAAHLVDHCFRVPRCTEPEFIPNVLDLCDEYRVKLLIPTIDTELPTYAQHRAYLQAAGTNVVVSDPETVDIALDKVETYRWLVQHHLPTVRQDSPEGVLSDTANWELPLIAKPRNGSASIGVTKVESFEMLRALAETEPDLVVQEYARGVEHTINILVQDSKCVCAVPHCRLETRGGEVSKASTRKNESAMSLAREIAEKLPGAYGPINIQCFIAGDNTLRVTEINARFGGGFPLANRAGAKFPRWLIEPMVGRSSTATFSGWDDNLLMLRYDSAIFSSGN